MTRRPVRLLGLLLLGPTLLSAQSPTSVPRQLTLARALEVARSSSPTYRQSLNDADPATVALRSARAGLFPTIASSGGVGYTGAGRSTFGGSFFNQSSPALSSNYSIGADWTISAATLMAPKQSKAELRATEENIAAAKVTLEADVTTQYLTALRAVASVEVAEQQVKRNQEFLDLAQARFNVGRANLIDVRQAEVTKAQGEVQLLRAQQSLVEAKIELLRRMGVPAGDIVDSLQLIEAFPLSEPTWQMGDLKRLALEANPSLKALEARREAATVGVRSARSAYLPSFRISTGLQGFTQQFTDEDVLINNALGGALGSASNCRFQNGILERLTSPHPAPNGGIIADCNAFSGLDATGTALDPAVRQSILDRNSTFPFNFSRQPWSVSFGISLPLWDGFQRSTRISQARAQEDDAREQLRARRLELDGAIQGRLAGVRTAFATARIQDLNRTAAREQLQLAQDRYRLGAGTALEVADAQNALTRAEVDYVTAVYDYHLAVASLEAAVGRPLR